MKLFYLLFRNRLTSPPARSLASNTSGTTSTKKHDEKRLKLHYLLPCSSLPPSPARSLANSINTRLQAWYIPEQAVGGSFSIGALIPALVVSCAAGLMLSSWRRGRAGTVGITTIEHNTWYTRPPHAALELLCSARTEREKEREGEREERKVQPSPSHPFKTAFLTSFQHNRVTNPTAMKGSDQANNRVTR